MKPALLFSALLSLMTFAAGCPDNAETQKAKTEVKKAGDEAAAAGKDAVKGAADAAKGAVDGNGAAPAKHGW